MSGTSAPVRVKKWLKWAGISQAELARRAACSAAYVSYLLAGEREAGLPIAVAIEREMRRPRAADGEFYGGPVVTPADWGKP